MSFGPPVLNLLGSLWVAPNKPSLAVANFTGIACQKFISPNAPMVVSTVLGANQWTFTTIIKVAANAFTPKRANVWEVPTGSGKYYYTIAVEDFYLGFASQFQGWLTFQCDANATVPRTY